MVDEFGRPDDDPVKLTPKEKIIYGAKSLGEKTRKTLHTTGQTAKEFTKGVLSADARKPLTPYEKGAIFRKKAISAGKYTGKALGKGLKTGAKFAVSEISKTMNTKSTPGALINLSHERGRANKSRNDGLNFLKSLTPKRRSRRSRKKHSRTYSGGLLRNFFQ